MYQYLQRLGRSLMLPVAVLPVAGLLSGIGVTLGPDRLNINSQLSSLLTTGSDTILGHLGILFALGVAIGMSKDRDGSSALSGLVAYLMVTNLLKPTHLANIVNVPVDELSYAFDNIENVFIGIISGLTASALYNKFSKTRLPDAFAFFSGRRLVPILTSFAMVVVSAILYFIWPPVYEGLVSFGTWISGMGWFGAGLYGFFNRLLIPTGLHHALNAVFWFDLIGIDDIANLWQSTGVKGITGMYQAGFFPVMMFGLPAAGFAIYRKADPKYRKEVGSLYLAGAVAAFVTGVTEPIEFSFMFVAPVLYLAHAFLTMLSLSIAAFMQWIAGFTFSAGAIDFLLSMNLKLANKPYMLIIQGLLFAVLYYLVFSFLIEKLDLASPGRKGPLSFDSDKDEDSFKEHKLANKAENSNSLKTEKEYQQARRILEALGGKDNIENFTNCATRLRLNVKDTSVIDQEKIKSSGAAGVKIMGKNAAHVIIGTNVQFVADALHDVIDEEK
ncbi:N-acetylglucosamine-specific PTS transporter subunit IIBC [Facklamia miroungae]|uniref:PTS system, N-acetylglucosamine-specific IIC component n=1 Tax=Facklamia miroungae TaxID=120956 RepID=A0A1G7QSG5_9LACT|nr:N-acetylglucosamine-specific PTS transporter subunit IIBC [Facklamia miroungae]NKZ29048.1 PTS transporter subunit EIIC [Facklamia miroungae]SDG01466.1 PTS system, N-acetylglucosamine-specific IIC component [Facklamia miroungae]